MRGAWHLAKCVAAAWALYVAYQFGDSAGYEQGGADERADARKRRATTYSGDITPEDIINQGGAA